MHDIQVIKEIELNAGKEYNVQLNIKSDKPGYCYVSYLLSKKPYTKYALQKLIISAGSKEYSCVLSIKKPSTEDFVSPKSIRILVGDFKDASLEISKISIMEFKK